VARRPAQQGFPIRRIARRDDPIARREGARRGAGALADVAERYGRVAVLSVPSSPLAPPGVGDSGGMNVTIRALAGELARAGIESDLYTRATSPDDPPVVELQPGVEGLAHASTFAPTGRPQGWKAAAAPGT